MPPKFADVSSLGFLAKHANGRWRVRAHLDGRHIYGPWRETKQRLLMTWPKRGVATRVPAILLSCRDLALGAPSSVSLLQCGDVLHRAVRPAAAFRNLLLLCAVVPGAAEELQRSKKIASVRKPPAQSGTQSSNELQPAAIAQARGRSGGMWGRSLSGASSRRGGSHPAQSRKRPRVSSPGAGEEDGDAASSVDAEILTSVRALGRYPIEHKNPKAKKSLESGSCTA